MNLCTAIGAVSSHRASPVRFTADITYAVLIFVQGEVAVLSCYVVSVGLAEQRMSLAIRTRRYRWLVRC